MPPDLSLPSDIVVPHHVALICDGNRRWARARGLPIHKGHEQGGEAIGEIARACRDFGIHTFTVWVFSTENWSRGEKEAGGILKIIEKALDQHISEAKKDDVRIIHLGRKDRLPESLARKLRQAENDTRNNKSYVFNLAIDYGGHDEIVRVTRKIVDDKIPVEAIDEKLFASYLDTNDQPYPYIDLLIRTSGEERLSGFMPWQTNYAEIWWDECLLPDFDRAKFREALLDYSRRRRRFGAGDSVRKFDFEPKLIAKLELDWWRARKFKEEGAFKKAFVSYLKAQFGTSLLIAKEAAEMFVKAITTGETEGNWQGTKRILTSFYSLMRKNVKLAFEPRLVASLEIEYLKRSDSKRSENVELQNVTRELYAELFRIPIFQANKIAYLRVLAQEQQKQADLATGKRKEVLAKKAEDYLVKSYEALKERVA
ncbi:di-trans,poly-cis-decaprenylcistransferase [Candidatus Microgenomates bacterium]|nr:di-trans,poly-cis-decaprenylcistransferase [Candidatus Microgenomates bacterium]